MDYTKLINEAMHFIDNHLEEPLTIERIASEVHISSFHFHRIFKTALKTSPYDYLLRRRMERAAFYLRVKPQARVSDIAFGLGFNSLENFSRQFKNQFKMAPSTYQKNETLRKSRIYQTEKPPSWEFSFVNDQTWYEVQLKSFDEIPAVMIPGTFGEDGSQLVANYQTLVQWATREKLEETLPIYGMSLDHMDITPASKYRYDFAIPAAATMDIDPVFQRITIPAGLWACVEVKGALDQVAGAWNYLYECWLPQNDYYPRHFPSLEVFYKRPEEIGWDRFDLSCRIPIKKINY